MRLGYRSPASNEIYVDRAGIIGVTDDLPLGTAWIPGGVRFVCQTPHENVTVYDMQGRAVMQLERVDNNTEVMLPVGVYVVTSSRCHTPTRIVVH